MYAPNGLPDVASRSLNDGAKSGSPPIEDEDENEESSRNSSTREGSSTKATKTETLTEANEANEGLSTDKPPH
jgi:hypothetical protein